MAMSRGCALRTSLLAMDALEDKAKPLGSLAGWQVFGGAGPFKPPVAEVVEDMGDGQMKGLRGERCPSHRRGEENVAEFDHAVCRLRFHEAEPAEGSSGGIEDGEEGARCGSATRSATWAVNAPASAGPDLHLLPRRGLAVAVLQVVEGRGIGDGERAGPHLPAIVQAVRVPCCPAIQGAPLGNPDEACTGTGNAASVSSHGQAVGPDSQEPAVSAFPERERWINA